MSNVLDKFLKYVKIDTQSNPNVDTCPSTLKQKDLADLLLSELIEMNVDAHLDSNCYVYAKLPANIKNKKAIGFIAHLDTSSDAPGNNVLPRIIKNYDGSTIKLNNKLSMSPKEYESLNRVINEDIIVTDGNTLLGADDKCGIAEIMTAIEYIQNNKDFKHGDVYICFTPDEEIGRGADLFNHEYFKADFAYTMDGDEVGGVEYENFNAASAKLEFIGKSIHPGSAKNKLVNSLHLAFEFHSMLPVFLNPAYTENYDGFNHLSNVSGEVESTLASYIIRNHNKELFENQKNTFITIKDYLNKKYNYECVKLTIKDSYFNMYEIIKDHMDVIDLAKEAITNIGLIPFSKPIRGGTDGARLTFDGLICPNLGTGGYQFHGRFEFASINQMEKAVKIILEIIKLNASK